MSVHFADSASNGPKIDLGAFASRAKDIDLGGGNDFEELDDLGVSLLANPNKVAPSPRGGASRQFSVSTPSGGGGGGEMPRLNINPVDDLEVVNLDAGPGVTDIKITRDGGGDGGGWAGGGGGGEVPFVINTGSADAFAPAAPSDSMSPEEVARQKQGYLTKLQRLENGGIKGQRMTMGNSLEELKAEYEKLTDSRNLEASLRFQRNALMTFVTGVEMVNDKFGHRLPVKPRLKGWSESVHTNIEDFDEIFEELYDLYKDKAKMHPLMRLVGTLGVSGVMYHLTNSAAERSGVPGMQDILNENPELQRQFAAAMMSKMGGGLGQFMSAAGGMPMGPPPSAMGPGVPPPAAPSMPSMPFNMGTSAAAAPAPQEQPRARREMRGPTGVDDILRAFEAERASSAAANINIGGAQAGVFTPSGPPPTPPRGVSILRQGLGSTADPLAEFMDDQSIGSGSTMNTERRRGRRRAAATPIGATLNLNV
jgi:hypothetical protein